MACYNCSRDDAWHRRQMDQLENTIGPVAVHWFEAGHPEVDEDEEGESPLQREVRENKAWYDSRQGVTR